MNNTAKKVAELLLSIKAFTFRFDPPYTYTNGLKSPVYLDNRLVMSYPEIRDQIIALYIETIKGKIIVETALENGQITQKEKDSIDVWFENPPAWAKKMGFE